MKTLNQLLNEAGTIVAPGAYDLVSAKIIEKLGFEVVYVTGLGVTATDLGKPDLSFIPGPEMVRKASTIVQSVNVPVICDADTGFGGLTNIWRTVKEYEAAGISGIQIEDQVFPKKCGALPHKEVIPAEEFAEKIRTAVKARSGKEMLIIARTDSKHLGVEEVIKRLNLYVDNGADMTYIGDYFTRKELETIVKNVKGPIVATDSSFLGDNIQPHFTVKEWEEIGVKIIFYWSLPLFTSIGAIQKALRMLKDKGTVQDMYDEIVSYKKYGEIVDLEIFEKLGKD